MDRHKIANIIEELDICAELLEEEGLPSVAREIDQITADLEDGYVSGVEERIMDVIAKLEEIDDFSRRVAEEEEEEEKEKAEAARRKKEEEEEEERREARLRLRERLRRRLAEEEEEKEKEEEEREAAYRYGEYGRRPLRRRLLRRPLYEYEPYEYEYEPYEYEYEPPYVGASRRLSPTARRRARLRGI